jgi:general secretion pathway protein D
MKQASQIMSFAVRLRPSSLTPALLSALLAGCALDAPPPLSLPSLVPTRASGVVATVAPGPVFPSPVAQTTISSTPTPPGGGAATQSGPTPSPASAAQIPDGPPVSLSIEQLPLPVFIDGVLGEALKLSYSVDPQVKARTDLVTLRLAKPRPPAELLGIAENVLRGYGVRLSFDADRVRVLPSEALFAEMPRVIRGRSLPDVPMSMRPLFQVVDLGSLSANDAAGMLRSAFGSKLQIGAVPSANAVTVMGLPDDVRGAVDALRVFDQPRLAGRRSARIDPIYWTAQRMADKLAEIMRAEGYDAASSGVASAAVTLVPVPAQNMVLGFAPDAAVLDHLTRWARELDQPARADPQRTVFFYPVKNTTADSLHQVLNRIFEGNSSPEEAAASPRAPVTTSDLASQIPPTLLAGVGGLPPLALPPGVSGGQGAPQSEGAARQPEQPTGTGQNQRRPRFIVDPARNGLIFMGSAEEFAQVRSLMETLDQAPREALIEVTIAEVTLDDSKALGVEWALNLGLGAYRGVASTIGSLQRGALGLNFTILNSAGDVRAILNAFNQDNRVSILSTPRVLTRSGGRARIQVGTEVPIVTSQATGAGFQVGGTTGFLQQVQYRTTGVILSVKPTIYAGNQIDLELTQEVSEAQQNQLTTVPSPIINNRQLTTQLSLRDGATVLLGGLISETRSAGETGIPLFADIPVLGNIFKTQKAGMQKRELLLFITPYVMQTGDDSQAISDVFKDRLQSLPQPTGRLKIN